MSWAVIGYDTGNVTDSCRSELWQKALINRYVVETVAADLMLGFFFPGAHMSETDLAPTASVETTA